MLGRSDHNEPDAPGRQVVHIEVAGGYRPAVVRARPGEAIRLVFHRLDDDDCTGRVIFSSPRLERRLAARGLTSVDLPPQAAGEIRYTCGMGRYSGVIRLEESPSSRLTAMERGVHKLGDVAVIALIVAAVGFPIVVALAFVGLGVIPAAVAAVLVLAAAVGIASRGMGKSGWQGVDAGPRDSPSETLPVALTRVRDDSGSRPGA